MLNPFAEVNWRPGPEERRKFAVSLVLGFPCVAAVLLGVGRWRGTSWDFGPALVLGGAGAALGGILWLAPRLARPVYVAWYALACSAGFVIGNLALTAVYLLVLAPLGIARRAAGRSALEKTFDRNRSSYWRDAPAQSSPARYFRQY